MQIFYNVSDLSFNPNTVLTVGTFDGLHLGHQEIVSAIKAKAASINGRSLLITFNPHPRSVLQKDFNLKILTTVNEKIELLKSYGLDELLIINFTPEFAALSSKQFIENYIINTIGVNTFFIGHDHQFGKDRQGNEASLRDMAALNNFAVSSIEGFTVDNDIISSTKIRRFVETGDMENAAKFLGRFYSVSGIVVKGDQRGRTLGFPTANVKPDDDFKLLPQIGIYAIRVHLENRILNGVLSIGKRPTFYNEGNIVIEANIFDFDEDIYDSFLKLEVVKKIRDEKRFSGKDELIAQMHLDAAESKKILNKLNN